MNQRSIGTAPWGSLSPDPLDPRVRAMQQTWAESHRHPAGLIDWHDELTGRARDRSVLDIGFVEHDASYMDAADWEHGIVAAAAQRCVGIDILHDEVEAAQQRGLEATVMDATGEETLDERFDLVVIGDVIEHVHSPERLLEFAGRHLTDDGRILLKTPNPHWLIHTIRCLFRGVVLENADHTAWFTPDNFRELADRTGLAVEWYAGSRGPAKKAWVDAIKQQRLFLKDNAVTWQSIVVLLRRAET